jgi:hypothetical protein
LSVLPVKIWDFSERFESADDYISIRDLFIWGIDLAWRRSNITSSALVQIENARKCCSLGDTYGTHKNLLFVTEE